MMRSKQNILDDQARFLDAQIAETKLPYTALHPFVLAETPRDPFNRILYSSDSLVRTAMLRYADTQMENRLLTLALALRAYRLKTATYPTALAQLTQAGILRQIPDDPFAPKSGVPLSYRLAASDHYLLYSIGPDGVDDGGLPIDTRYANGNRRASLDAADKGDWVVGVDTVLSSGQ